MCIRDSVAIYAIEKATQLGVKVLTCSDSNGWVYDPDGIDVAEMCIRDRLWKEEPEIFGNYPGSQVPLLIKINDAENDLSIQVHPDDAYAGCLLYTSRCV